MQFPSVFKLRIFSIIAVMVFAIKTQAQSFSYYAIAGNTGYVSAGTGVTNAYVMWYSNNAGTGSSKDIHIALSGAGSGDSIIFIANNTEFKARAKAKSTTWFNVVNQSLANVNNTGSGTNVQRGVSLTTGDTALDVEIRCDRTTSHSSYSQQIYILIKKSGSTANTSKYLRIFPYIIAQSNIFKWNGDNNSSFHTATNWSPSRSTPSTSDVLIFDNAVPKKVQILYNSGQFSQTIEQIMITANTKIRFVNYTGSNGAAAKSTLKLNSGNNQNRIMYDWDQTLGMNANYLYNGNSGDVGDLDLGVASELGVSGTDTIQIEFLNGAFFSNNFYSPTIRTYNTEGNGACLKLYTHKLMSQLNGVYYYPVNWYNDANTTISFASNNSKYILGGPEYFGWGTPNTMGTNGKIVVEAGTRLSLRGGDGGTMMLGGIWEVYGGIAGKLVSNAPASNSAADWKSWVPTLQLKSDATRHGYIDTLGNNWDESSVEGGVLWEMYNSGTRSWRTVGFPLRNAMNISQIANNIVITGTKNTTNADSFYSFNSSCSYCKSSLMNWSESTSAWVGAESGSSTSTINPGKGVLLFFRGLGGNGVGDASSSATAGSMSFKGEINYGDFTLSNLSYTSGAGSLKGVNLIANPYPCAIDWRSVIANSGNSNIADKFYYFNPKAQNYSVYNKTSGTLVLSGSKDFTNSTDAEAATIEQGAAFFVVTSNSSNTLNFKESNKTPGKPKTSAFKVGSEFPCNRLTFQLNYNTTTSPREDNGVLEWDMDHIAGVDDVEDFTDQAKLYAGYLGIGTVDANKLWYAIDRRKTINEGEQRIIPLLVKTLEATDYKITFETCLNGANAEIELVDKLKGTKTKVTKDFVYVFTTSATDTIKSDNRFELILTKAAANNTTQLNLINQYYVYPNPIESNAFRITSAQSPIQNVKLFNMNGQELADYSSSIISAGNYPLPKNIANGNYWVKIIHATGTQVQQIHIQR